jgi:hypothetical protein
MIHKRIPFEFVLDHLLPLDVKVKPMFGMHGVYAGAKIVLLLRQRKDHPADNGVWIASRKEHHAGLKKILPSMRSISTFAGIGGETGWQVLPVDADDFEESVVRTCGLIIRGDTRIGRIPRQRRARRQGRAKRSVD